MDEKSPTKQSKETDHDRQMLRNLTHEISNTVTSNMLILTAAMEDKVTLCCKNVEYLSSLFDLIEDDISEEKREEILDYFQKIERNEQALDKVIRILTRSNNRAIETAKLASEFSRLGRLAVDKEPVQLQNILEAVVQEHQKVFVDQKISVRLKGSAKNPLTGHRPHLHLLFNHIVQNACQALAECKKEHEPLLEIILSESEDRQIVTIRDNAKGIPKKNLQDIFEPFYSSRPKKRIGLGLNFVSKLVAMYGGTIDVESAPGKGTAFTLTFSIQK
jgi:signal transduction histidine kinase